MSRPTEHFDFSPERIPSAAIWIPSRSRTGIVQKNVDSWLRTDLPVHVVVEPQQEWEYRAALEDTGARVDALDENDRGIGYARDSALEMADREGYEWMIFCDDDVVTPQNVDHLVFAANKWELPGCGAMFRLYRHYLNMTPHTGVWLTRTGLGLQCFALRVDVAMLAGGFDHECVSRYEDHDLRFKLLREGCAPWSIHSGVEAQHTATIGSAGGCSSLPGDRDELEHLSALRMVELYPEWCSVTKRGLRRRWKRVHEDCGWSLPLEWRGLRSIEGER